MWTSIRRLVITIFTLTLASGGLAYATTNAPSWLGAIRPAAEDLQPSVLDVGAPGETDDAQERDESEPEDESRRDRESASEREPRGPQRSTEGCRDGFAGNHGRHVSGTDEQPRRDAARSPCGKPLRASRQGDRGSAEPGEADKPPTQKVKKDSGRDHGRGPTGKSR